MTRYLVGLLLLASCCLPAHAHTLSVSHLDVGVPADGVPVRVELDLSIRDLALTVPVDRNRDERVTWGELLDARERIDALVATGLVLSTARGTCEMKPDAMAIRRYDDGAYAALRYTAHCPSADALRIHYTLMMDRDPQHRALVTIRRGEQVTTAVAHSRAPRVDTAMQARPPFLDFLREGVHHILIGYDHLAFLISLLLPAALVRVSGRWQPAPSFRSSFLHVLGIATAFTVAHSITLSLAALGWVTPASRWVEAAIAASVLLAALNNLRPVVTRRLWVVGFVFGLIHGFGFAGALGELGLPDGDRPLALVGFNAGVELGQIAVVIAALPLLFAVRRRSWYPRWAMPALTLTIAALAGYWLWERLG